MANLSCPQQSDSTTLCDPDNDRPEDQPLISVIVPVRNSPKELQLCLKHLAASTFRRFEVIVVDDASTDNTAEVGEENHARVLRLPRNLGPAGARNCGAEVARGEYLLFLDADVLAHTETLQQLVDTFERAPHVAAVFGSYDTVPNAGNVLSQYKNLFHHFVHQDCGGYAQTFWSGCGAIRRDIFDEIGRFDATYARPSIEDIELGARLHRAGRKILLDKTIQVTHLKRWTLWSIFKTDVVDRGIPWTELMLRGGEIPNYLNVKYSQRISVALAYGLLMCFGVAVWYYRQLLLLPLCLLLAIAFFDYWSTRRHFRVTVRICAALTGLGLLAAVGYMYRWWPLLPLALIVGIVAINFRFYWFFWCQKHQLLFFLVLPLHVFYYLYCGMAFGIGLTRHVWKQRVLRRKGSSVGDA